MKKSLFIVFFALMSFSCVDSRVETAKPFTISEPTVSTDSAVSISSTSVILYGKANPSGVLTYCSFDYGLSTDYGFWTHAKNIGSGSTDVSLIDTISSLSRDTIYHFRINAQFSEKFLPGLDKTFRTITIPQPTASTEPVSSTMPNNAILKGIINPGGVLMNYYFEYGTTTSYGFQTPIKYIGSGLTDVSCIDTISFLQSGTTYHFRIVAKYNGGTILGQDREFLTASEFIYPISIGSTWTYKASYVNYDMTVHWSYWEYGTETYTALFFAANDVDTTWTLRCTRNLRAINSSQSGQVNDTTYIVDSSYTTITKSTEAIVVTFARSECNTIPRFFVSSEGVVKLDCWGMVKFGSIIFTSGIGLTQYNYSWSGNSGSYGSMTLLSFSP
jgi:hypothetical protein